MRGRSLEIGSGQRNICPWPLFFRREIEFPTNKCHAQFVPPLSTDWIEDDWAMMVRSILTESHD